MPASVTSPADIINLSLRRIGYALRVGNLYDGSKAASTALDLYAQTRDELLRDGNWGFAERNVALTLLKQAPVGGYVPPTSWSSAYPPLPWQFEYSYPGDCLKVRAIKSVPIFIPNMDPTPVVFGLENDNSLAPPAKVILCNIADAVMVYTGQVTDPTTWEADFVEALADALGERLAASLKDINAQRIEAQAAPQTQGTAMMNQG